MTTPSHYQRWTPQDDRTLRFEWGSLGLTALSKTLGRTPIATYYRARHLGLKAGCPDHGEYISHAAKRTGFSVSQLRGILHSQGMRPRPAMAAPHRRGAWNMQWVDPLDVDDAVAAFMAMETPQAAARRCGVSPELIVDLMSQASVAPAKRSKRGGRLHRLFPSSAIDSAVAQWRSLRALPTVRQHAARVGLDRVTLAKRLRRAGVLGPKKAGNGGTVRLAIETVDHALGRTPQ